MGNANYGMFFSRETDRLLPLMLAKTVSRAGLGNRTHQARRGVSGSGGWTWRAQMALLRSAVSEQTTSQAEPKMRYMR